jgi:hypothetical protein
MLLHNRYLAMTVALAQQFLLSAIMPQYHFGDLGIGKKIILK